MGLEIDRTEFDANDRRLFSERLACSLDVLAELLERPGFGEGPMSLGAELEVSLVDEAGRPRPRNIEVLGASGDPRLTVELDRFNIEANLRHGPLEGASFSRLIEECIECLEEIERAAAPMGSRVAMVGILPTLRREDLLPESMTESLRYEALSRSLRQLRDEPFLIDIHGEDDLRLEVEDVTYEGAATSFQVHLRVSPEDFAAVYDSIQLASAPVLAVSGNSPTFLGRRLWHETRIALFKQAVDHRAERGARGRDARVSFGHDWTGSPLDLFTESVHGHDPLLPVLDDEDPRGTSAGGGTPRLRELRLHQGTVWRWNRAIYDHAEGGHLRIELRALPAGPTVRDMAANAAFHIGLALYAARSADEWRDETDFDVVHGDFYRAAREGPGALIHWPRALGGSGEPMSAARLVPELLDRAREGCEAARIDSADLRPLFEGIEARMATGRTGAGWQLRALARAEQRRNRAEAIETMFKGYLDRSREGEPVHLWTDLK
jgi:hypothetical protein